jgi:hypothetical protein
MMVAEGRRVEDGQFSKRDDINPFGRSNDGYLNFVAQRNLRAVAMTISVLGRRNVEALAEIRIRPCRARWTWQARSRCSARRGGEASSRWFAAHFAKTLYP